MVLVFVGTVVSISGGLGPVLLEDVLVVVVVLVPVLLVVPVLVVAVDSEPSD